MQIAVLATTHAVYAACCRVMKAIVVAMIACASACTTLGPMPATTGISAVPSDRPGLEVQAAIVPAFYLSDAAQSSNAGQATGQLSLLLEPDRLLGIPGLIVGLRQFGGGDDTLVEPYVGIRRRVTDDLSLAAIGYGTATSAANSGASYSATRLGGELAADIRVLEIGAWVALHWQISASLTDIEASGNYCIDSTTGLGVDCNNDGTDTRVNGNVSGAFGAGTAQLSLDIGHRPSGVFHDVRLAVLASAGQMPQLSFGQEVGRTTYTSWGLSLTLGLGAEH
jgi:hypothetical protein